MKLRNKLLTVLPVTAIGALTPIVISGCSCGTQVIDINYGDAINCKDNKSSTPAKYYDIKVIKNSTSNKVQVIEDEQPISWDADLSKNQQFYWDLAYSSAYYSHTFTLTWVKAGTKGNFDGTEFNSLKYEKENNEWKIKTDGGVTLIRSYTYSLNKN